MMMMMMMMTTTTLQELLYRLKQDDFRMICTALEIYSMKIRLYRVSQEECAILRESVPYVKLYRYNPKHLYPKLNGYGDNGQRSLKL